MEDRMGLTEKEQTQALDQQVREWSAELRRLAGLIATAKGTSSALVMITGTDDDYTDIAPQLILEDALRVNPHGWPKGFDIDLLNPSN